MSRYYSSILNVLSPSFTNTYSLAFDGVDDFLETTKTAALTTASLSMWVKVTGNFAVNERQSLASNDDFNHGRDFIIADTPTTTNEAYIGMFAGGIIYGKTSASGGIPINDGNWHHLVWTYDGSAGTSASINLYVDGQNQYSNASYSSYWSYEIKFQYFGKPTSANTYFSGSMDEVAYFDSILSSSEITTMYNSGVPNDLTSLNPIVWLRNGDNGTFKSPQWLIPNNENKTKFSNYSFEYDGVDNYVQLSSVVSFASEFSLSIWVKPNGINTNQVILGNGSSSNNWVRLSSASSITFKVGSTSLNFADVGNNLVDGIWQHLLFYRDSSNNVGIFRNGTAFSTTQSNTNTLELSTIAKRGNIEYTGLIDEVAFWQSDKLSDVSSIYNSGVPTDISSLSPVGYWRSENSTFLTNWTVTDNGSGGNNGTSANMTIEDRVGDASNSSNNAVSFNQVEADRKTDIPS